MIHVELVPQSCFFTNVRSQVSQKYWDILRRAAYKKAGYCCEICKAKGRMEAHEIWHYDDKNLIQKLFKIVCLCNACHLVYHLGYAATQGRLPQTMARLGKINGWSAPETREYVDAVFEIFYMRSQKAWTLDLTLLDAQGIAYTLPGNRNKISHDKLSEL